MSQYNSKGRSFHSATSSISSLMFNSTISNQYAQNYRTAKRMKASHKHERSHSRLKELMSGIPSFMPKSQARDISPTVRRRLANLTKTAAQYKTKSGGTRSNTRSAIDGQRRVAAIMVKEAKDNRPLDVDRVVLPYEIREEIPVVVPYEDREEIAEYNVSEEESRIEQREGNKYSKCSKSSKYNREVGKTKGEKGGEDHDHDDHNHEYHHDHHDDDHKELGDMVSDYEFIQFLKSISLYVQGGDEDPDPQTTERKRLFKNLNFLRDKFRAYKYTRQKENATPTKHTYPDMISPPIKHTYPPVISPPIKHTYPPISPIIDSGDVDRLYSGRKYKEYESYEEYEEPEYGGIYIGEYRGGDKRQDNRYHPRRPPPPQDPMQRYPPPWTGSIHTNTQSKSQQSNSRSPNRHMDYINYMYDSLVAGRNQRETTLGLSYSSLHPNTHLPQPPEPHTPTQLYSARAPRPFSNSKPQTAALASLKDTLSALNDTSCEMKSVFQGINNMAEKMTNVFSRLETNISTLEDQAY